MATGLLIDDMTLLRGAAGAILTRAGSAVREAPSGEAGIAPLREQGFDLVAASMTMPGQGDGEVIAGAHAMRGRSRILALSGGDSDLSADEVPGLARVRAGSVMVKPFGTRELVRTAGDLLAEPA